MLLSDAMLHQPSCVEASLLAASARMTLPSVLLVVSLTVCSLSGPGVLALDVP